MTDINVGIIGFGRIGAEHAGWLAKAQGIGRTLVVDSTAARRERAIAMGLEVGDSYDALLSNRDIDAVLIATPSAMHFEQAAAALEVGKHIMIEKPMTLELDQARRLIELARSRDKVLSVFHNRRWDIDFLTVKENVASGTFGRIINIESRIAQWASCVGPAAREWRPNWRNESAYGGGGLFDWGSHLLDQMWRLFWPAMPMRVFAQLRGNVWAHDCDDFARVVIDFDDGGMGMVEINTTTMSPLARWHIDGTEGSASSPTSLDYDTNKWARLEFAEAKTGERRMISPATVGLSEPDIWSRFAQAVQGIGLPAVAAESVLLTMALLDAARQSSRDGRAVGLLDRESWTY